jgi:membrane protein DedA with SNARE-associated domain
VIGVVIAAGAAGYLLGLITIYVGGAWADARARRRATAHPHVIELDRARAELHSRRSLQ